jgi:hypothetical protein
MSAFFPPIVRIEHSDDSCGTVLLFCTEPGDHVTASAGAEPGSFRWYEQDSGDDLADEILAWASAEEATLPQAAAGPAGDFSPGRQLPV